MREIKDRNEFSSHTPCAFLLVYDNYCQIRDGYVDSDHSLMKHIEWKLHGKEENLSWLKCGEYELVDVTRVFVKEIPYSDSITEQLEPAESDLRCIREEAQEMYQRDLKDDIPDEIYRQIVKWSSDSPPFVYKIRNGD